MDLKRKEIRLVYCTHHKAIESFLYFEEFTLKILAKKTYSSPPLNYLLPTIPPPAIYYHCQQFGLSETYGKLH
jgi:hypothetical protein